MNIINNKNLFSGACTGNNNRVNIEENMVEEVEVEEEEEVEEEKNNINQIKIMNLNASKNLFGSQDNILGDTPQLPGEQEIDPISSVNDFAENSPRWDEDGYVKRLKISANDFYSSLGRFKKSKSYEVVNEIKKKDLDEKSFVVKYRSIYLLNYSDSIKNGTVGILASVYDRKNQDITNYIFINHDKVANNIRSFDDDFKEFIKDEIKRLSEEASDNLLYGQKIRCYRYAISEGDIIDLND